MLSANRVDLAFFLFPKFSDFTASPQYGNINRVLPPSQTLRDLALAFEDYNNPGPQPYDLSDDEELHPDSMMDVLFSQPQVIFGYLFC